MQKGVTLLAIGLSVASCAKDPIRTTGPSLDVRVAPLELPGVADACYTLAVYNVAANAIDPSALVWTEPSICADRFGDERGSISYVGPCDAQPDGRTNTVSLVLEGLCAVDGCDPGDDDDPATIDSDTYVNPCPSGRPCLIERPCRANGDVSVTFDLTIMRDAGQGFFDIGVTFQDVFCSAKLDCVDQFLHRPDGPRDLTAILAFACTSGGASTCLYATSVELDCGGANVWTIDPSLGPGKIPESSPLLYGAATYQGDEAFLDFDKSYWNVALGLDEAAFSTYPSCTLRWTTTASEVALDGAGPFTTPAETSYPLLVWERDILVGGALACASHPLDVVLPGEDAASVHTDYASTAAPTELAHSTCAPAACAPGDPDADADGVPDACDSCPDGQTFAWVTWDEVTGTTATGTVGAVGVTYTSSATITSTPAVFSHATFPTSYGVPDVDPTIQNTAVTTNTLTFAQPVTNPMLVFASIGNTIADTIVPIAFDRNVKLLWCSGLVDGPDPLTAQPITCAGQMVDTIYGYEGYAIVEVPGTHTSVGFDYTVAESYANFVFGMNTCAGDEPPDPPPLTYSLTRIASYEGFSAPPTAIAEDGRVFFLYPGENGNELAAAYDETSVVTLYGPTTASAFGDLYSELAVDGLGRVVFRGNPVGSSDAGIFRGDGQATTTIASPAGFGHPGVNAAGLVVFTPNIDDAAALVRADGQTTESIYVAGVEGFTSFGSGPDIDASGRIAFLGYRGGDDTWAVAVGDGGGLQILADTAAGGAFSQLAIGGADGPVVNDAGQVAFWGMKSDGTQGIYLAALDDGALTTVADSAGAFANFSRPAINEAGLVAFAAGLDSEGGGFPGAPRPGGVFFGPDPATDVILLNGATLDGKVVSRVRLEPHGVNGAGQVALSVRFTDRTVGVYRADPD